MRTLQFLPWMAKAGWDVEFSPLFSDAQLSGKYQSGRYGVEQLIDAYARRLGRLAGRKRFDVVWIEKEALPWLPVGVESWLLRDVPYVLDFDDALFHKYDRHRSALVRRVLGRRLDRLMAGASLVVAGNRYLADRAARAGARWVEVLPTVVDLERYALARRDAADPLRIVWIGSPSTVRYLQILQKPLTALAERRSFQFRVIGGGDVVLPGVNVEMVPWSVDTEASSLGECHVGVMPLEDSPWEKGKCAYKLIQYMACGLPGVASPVGANVEVVIDGKTGFLADTPEAWVLKLDLLLREADLRDRMGAAGRSLVESKYCLQVAAPRLIQLLARVPVRGR